MQKTLALLFGCWLACSCMHAGAQQWLPVPDTQLEVQAGSVLDFSSFSNDAPAGQHGWATVLADGHIGFENLPVQQRFLAASFAFSRTSGGVPDHGNADRIAIQLRRAGYNAVRLHFLDAHLMTGRANDFDFDPEQYEKFQYFLARLKAAGLYWVIDVLDSDNAAYGGVTPHRWVNKYNFRIGFYTEPEKQEHWAKLLTRLLGQTNPHTGISPLKDPTLLGLVLINEGGIAELSTRAGGRFSARFAPHFRHWLKIKYGSTQALAAAWRGELKDGETLDSIVEVPPKLRGQDERSKDFMRFASALETEKLAWMTAQARAAGYKGLVTAYNNWGFHHSDSTRTNAQWVDMHAYHVLPSDFVSPGSKVAQTSAVANAAKIVRELAGARQWGKPFTVTEYGQPFWNAWRRESVALVPAYAALHEWDLITNFAENSFQLDLRASPYLRKNSIHPFGISNDPILSSGERLAALLYKRGDIKASPSRVHIPLDSNASFAANGGWGQLTESTSRLALLSATGLNVDTAPSNVKAVPGKRDHWPSPSGPSNSAAGLLDGIVVRSGMGSLTGSKEDLVQKGLLQPANETNLSKQHYQSDTGELSLDVPSKVFTVASPRTALISMASGHARAGGLTVSEPTVPMLAAVSSMDGNELLKSRRMLLFVLTDAQNSGMTFTDASRTELRTLGTLPALLQTVQLTLTLKTTALTAPKVFALSLAGGRRDLLPATVAQGYITLKLDTSKLAQGPSTMFEIAFE
jgi:hypothetical protein